MKLELHNILKIGSAKVEFNGLTVLTGGNDSGKSTIGKILFSLIKAANEAQKNDVEDIVNRAKGCLMGLKKVFQSSGVVPDLLEQPDQIAMNLINKKVSFSVFDRVVRDEVNEKGFDLRRIMRVFSILAEIKKLISISEPQSAIQYFFYEIAKSEFQASLGSFETNESSIIFDDDATGEEGGSINMRFEDNQLTSVSFHENFLLEDITYIDSPMFLHVLNILQEGHYTLSTRPRERIPRHLSDLTEKLLDATAYAEPFAMADSGTDTSLILKDIAKVAGGQFVVENDTKRMFFQQRDHIIPPINVAAGIKSFGILQRLIQTGNISSSKMLVWDEPEIHLHPQWQVVLCKLLVDLVSVGMPIVVSSHSPYFIQGLRYFASLKGIERSVRYYMPADEMHNKLSDFKDVTGDLNRVFSILAQPLHSIMNVDAVRNRANESS